MRSTPPAPIPPAQSPRRSSPRPILTAGEFARSLPARPLTNSTLFPPHAGAVFQPRDRRVFAPLLQMFRFASRLPRSSWRDNIEVKSPHDLFDRAGRSFHQAPAQAVPIHSLTILSFQL